jgi:hypothetical protein
MPTGEISHGRSAKDLMMVLEFLRLVENLGYTRLLKLISAGFGTGISM